MPITLTEAYNNYLEVPNLVLVKELYASIYKELGGVKNTEYYANEPLMWLVRTIKKVDKEFNRYHELITPYEYGYSKGDFVAITAIQDIIETTIPTVVREILNSLKDEGYRVAGSRVSHEGKSMVTYKVTGDNVDVSGVIILDREEMITECARALHSPELDVYFGVYLMVISIAGELHRALPLRKSGNQLYVDKRQDFVGIVFSFLGHIVNSVK